MNLTPCPKCGLGLKTRISHSVKNPNRPYIAHKKCNFFKFLAPLLDESSIIPKNQTVNKIDHTMLTKATNTTPSPNTPVFDFETDFNEPTIEPLAFPPSPYQEAIFDFVVNSIGHGICFGVAGCSKTTTNIEAYRQLIEKHPRLLIKILAFNSHIAKELRNKNVLDAQTFGSLGMANIKAAMPNAKMEPNKVFNICDEIEIGLEWEVKGQIAKIIGLLKSNLIINPTIKNVLQLIDSFPSIDLIDEDKKDSLARTSIR